MASFLGGAPVTLAGQTWTTVVSAPASGKQRQVLSVAPRNRDTIEHQFELRKNKGGTFYDLESPIILQAGKGGQLVSQCVVLAATDESLEARMAEAASSVQPQVDVSVFEVP